MDETRELLEAYNRKIVSVYIEHELSPLSGHDGKYLLSNGKALFSWESEITRHRNCHYDGNPSISRFNYMHLLDDILLCSDEILYFTAQLFLYRPYINNPLRDSINTNTGTPFFPVIVNTATRRYQMFTNVCYEKVYNFWDRIGDLIASYFPSIFTGHIYFGNVIDRLERQYSGNADFAWLLDFKKNHYVKYNEERIKSVHNISLATEQKWTQLEHVTDEEKTRELVELIQGYPEQFRDMHNLSKEGVVKALSFLEFLNGELGYACPQ